MFILALHTHTHTSSIQNYITVTQCMSTSYWENRLDVIEEATCGEGKFILFIIYLR